MRKTATSDPDSGKARLARRVGANLNDIASEYHPAASQPWPTRDTFFTVTVQRTGIHTVVRVDNTVVYEGNDLTDTTPGRIGFFAQFNNGRFDDVSVTDNTPTSFLFRSGFNSSVVTTTPTCIGGTWFVNLSGADASGMAWQPTFWGAPDAPAFNTSAPCTSSSPPSAMDAYVSIGIKQVDPGPTGPASRILWNNVMQWHTNNDLSIEPRAGVNHVLLASATPAQSYYIRRYLRYPANLLWDDEEAEDHGRMGENGWFTQHEYKSRREPFAGRRAQSWVLSQCRRSGVQRLGGADQREPRCWLRSAGRVCARR
jgi:hypothetical protein